VNLYQSLTKRQQSTMKKHAKHHTKKHMQEMTKLMSTGKKLSFTEAHKKTMAKIGA